MGELKSMSLEAKAAIVGAFYAFEQLIQQSSQFGTQLVNASTILKTSPQTLQQYQYAARQAGASNESLIASFKSLQNIVANAEIGKGVPDGFKLIAQTVGGIDFKKAGNDTAYFFQKLQQFAQSGVRPELKKMWLSQLGLSDDIIAGLERGKFDPSILAKAPRYTDNQLAQLDKIRASWSNLGTEIDMAFGKFNAKHGQEIVHIIEGLIQPTIKLSEALLQLVEALHIFDALGFIEKGASKYITELSGTVKDVVKKPGAESKLEAVGKFLEDTTPVGILIKALSNIPISAIPKFGSGGIQTNVNQTITVTGHQDAKAIGELHKSAARSAHHQAATGITKARSTSGAQGQAN